MRSWLVILTTQLLTFAPSYSQDSRDQRAGTDLQSSGPNPYRPQKLESATSAAQSADKSESPPLPENRSSGDRVGFSGIDTLSLMVNPPITIDSPAEAGHKYLVNIQKQVELFNMQWRTRRAAVSSRSSSTGPDQDNVKRNETYLVPRKLTKSQIAEIRQEARKFGQGLKSGWQKVETPKQDFCTKGQTEVIYQGSDGPQKGRALSLAAHLASGLAGVDLSQDENAGSSPPSENLTERSSLGQTPVRACVDESNFIVQMRLPVVGRNGEELKLRLDRLSNGRIEKAYFQSTDGRLVTLDLDENDEKRVTRKRLYECTRDQRTCNLKSDCAGLEANDVANLPLARPNPLLLIMASGRIVLPSPNDSPSHPDRSQPTDAEILSRSFGMLLKESQESAFREVRPPLEFGPKGVQNAVASRINELKILALGDIIAEAVHNLSLRPENRWVPLSDEDDRAKMGCAPKERPAVYRLNSSSNDRGERPSKLRLAVELYELPYEKFSVQNDYLYFANQLKQCLENCLPSRICG